MNILLINHYAGSLSMGREYRPYYLARELLNRGHKPTIIAADYSHLRAENPPRQPNFRPLEIDGIPYVFIHTSQYRHNGLKRAFTMQTFSRKLYNNASRVSQEFRPDVVVASSTYPFDTYPAQRLARISKALYLHEVHDMWPDTLIELGGMSPKHPFVRAMRRAERSFCRHADGVLSILPATKDDLVGKGLAPDKWRFLPNGVVLSDWDDPTPLPQEHRVTVERLRRDGNRVIGYFGGHALSNNLDTLLELAQVTRDLPVRYVLVGDGMEKERLMSVKAERRLDNVYFLDPIEKTAVPEFLKLVDVTFICGRYSPLYRFGGGMQKMYDAMMAGKPILMALNLADNPIEAYRCGWVHHEPGDLAGLAARVAEICAMPDAELEAIGERGHRAVIEHFTYSRITENFLQYIEEFRGRKI